ncbi:MAG: hypothetical protein ACI4GD_09470 [Lachnospiraceae bacterium]
MQTHNTEQFYKDRDLRGLHRQRFCNGKLNRDCESVIRNGKPVTLTLEQREQFVHNICDIPDNTIGIITFCGMVLYVCMTWMLPIFVFIMASVFSSVNKRLSGLLYIAGATLLLLVLGGFVGLCILIKRKTKNHVNTFRTEAREKITRGDYQSYTYRIEETYRVKSYDEDEYGGYVYFWHRVGNVLFELPNSSFAYNLSHDGGIQYKDPQKVIAYECSHPAGTYIIGMLIHLDGQERFYAM